MSAHEILLGSRRKLDATLRRASRPLRGIWPNAGDAAIGLLALVVVGFALMTYVTPLVIQASGFATSNRYLAALEGFLNPFRNRNLLLSSGLPVYDLQIGREEYAAIEAKIAEAKKIGVMREELQIWVDAKFFHNGQEYNVDVRVRGDLPEHWENPKKSWRIKFGNQTIEQDGESVREPIYFQGKRQINLIILNDKGYIIAPFVNMLMQEAGLVTLRDQFVVLRINGVLQGLYYEVEHFDKPLLAAARRPETSIVGQNGRSMHFDQYTKYGALAASDARFDAGSLGFQVEEEGPLAMQAMRVMQVLLDHSVHPSAANFKRARAVLDWEKYLAFRNITTLFNTNHVRFGSDNLKLFFDASRGLFEPIPWDVHLVRMPKEPGTIDYWNSHGLDELQRFTLMDPMLRLQRNQMLWAWVSDGGDSLIARYTELHDKIRPLVWADVLTTPIQAYRMDELKKDFEFNVHRVHRVLSLSSANVTYRLEANDRAAIEVTALNFSGIRLQGIQITDPNHIAGSYQLFEDRNDDGLLDSGDPLVAEVQASAGTVAFELDKYVLPDVKYASDTIDGRYWEYFDTLAGRSRYFVVGKLAVNHRPYEWVRPEISVSAVNAVTEQPMPSAFIPPDTALPEGYIGIAAYDASSPFDLAAPALSQAEFLQAHPEFIASEEWPGAVELQGRVAISGTVIVPTGAPLILRPGTDLTMMPGANLLAFGGLLAVGTPEQRVRIHGDESGEAWGVVASVRSPTEVVLDYLDVSGGGEGQINGILFTGGLAVHDSDLRIANCTVSGMFSEDGLNLKNGQIEMENCRFSGNASDGVDVDFGTGYVRHSQFLDSVGDGLDLSGSTLTIANNRFERNGDKGLSIGEDSHPTVVNNLFLGNQIGLSIKDLSHARIAYSTFVENVLAVEVKRKKPFFGGGSGELFANVFAGNQTLLDDDYFSKGQTTIQNSIADDVAGCETCRMVDFHFVAPERGDYRLVADLQAGSDLEMALPDWLELAGFGGLPTMPGVFVEKITGLP